MKARIFYLSYIISNSKYKFILTLSFILIIYSLFYYNLDTVYCMQENPEETAKSASDSSGKPSSSSTIDNYSLEQEAERKDFKDLKAEQKLSDTYINDLETAIYGMDKEMDTWQTDLGESRKETEVADRKVENLERELEECEEGRRMSHEEIEQLKHLQRAARK